jgi:hypothetical protein
VQKSLLHFSWQCVKIKIQKDCRFAMAAAPKLREETADLYDRRFLFLSALA